MFKHSIFRALAAGAALCAAATAQATSYTLGEQDFADGALLNGVTPFEAAQAGEPAPLDRFIGTDFGDPVGSRFLNFSVAPGTYASASITLGLWDIDSLSPGSQLLVFSADGVDLTAELDALFESKGGHHSEVSLYTLTLSGAALAALDDGAVSFRIRVGGTGLQGTPGTRDELTPGNGYGIDFARLDASLQSVPLPGTLPLLLGALGALAWRRRPR